MIRCQNVEVKLKRSYRNGNGEKSVQANNFDVPGNFLVYHRVNRNKMAITYTPLRFLHLKKIETEFEKTIYLNS